MKRIALVLLAASAVLLTDAARAQQPPTPPAPPLIDWEKIQIKTTDLGNNTYMLEGQGGNITVAVGTDGIIMVDTQFADLSDRIKAAIKAISPLPAPLDPASNAPRSKALERIVDVPRVVDGGLIVQTSNLSRVSGA